MVFVVLCPGAPEGSTGSGSDFRESQKTELQLKVSSDRLGEAENQTCDPRFTRHRLIPYIKAAPSFTLLMAMFLGYNQYWPVGFEGFFMSRSNRRLTGSGSGLKASQKTGPRLKVSSETLEEAGNRTCDPRFNRHPVLCFEVELTTLA